MYNPTTNDITKKAITLLTAEMAYQVQNMSFHGAMDIDLAVGNYRLYKKGVLDTLDFEEKREVVTWMDKYNLTIEHFRFALTHEDLESLGARVKRITNKINGGV